MKIINLKNQLISITVMLILVACGGQSVTPAQQETVESGVASTKEEASFASNVLPIFQENCTRCHGSSRQSGGLRLDSYAVLIAGGKDGAVIVPGDAPSSLLVELVTSGDMPRNAAPLPDAEIQAIIEWVDAGAKDN